MANTKIPVELSSTPGIVDGSNATAITIDSSERVLVGFTTSDWPNPSFQIEGIGASTSGLNLFRNSNDASGPYLNMGSSRGTSVNSDTIVQNGDALGTIYFYGAGGSDREQSGGYIQCAIDGTPGNNDMPGRLVFATTADGGVGGTERMRITAGGLVGIGTTNPIAQLGVGGAGRRIEIDGTSGVIRGFDRTASWAALDFEASAYTFDCSTARMLDVAASGVIINEDSADADFRVESNNLTHALFVDGGNNNVAIGHSTATGAKLAICDGANAQIQFFPEVTTDTNLIQHYDITSTTYMNADYRAATHQFKIGTSEAMRIHSDGKVGIGVDAPTALLDIRGSGTGNQKLHFISTSLQNGGDMDFIFGRDNGTALSGQLSYYYNTTQGSRYIQLRNYGRPLGITVNDGGRVGIGNAVSQNFHSKAANLIVGDGNAGGMSVWNGTAEGWYAFARDDAVNSDAYDGGISYNGARQLKFHTTAGGTRMMLNSDGLHFGSDTAAANALDDNEEGTWTPTFKDLGGNLATLSTANGRYTKIGRQVILNFHVIVSSKGSMTGNYLHMGNLPFSHPTDAYNGSGTIDYFSNFDTNYSWLGFDTSSTGSVMWLVGVVAAGAASTVYVPTSAIGGNETFKGTIIYTVS